MTQTTSLPELSVKKDHSMGQKTRGSLDTDREKEVRHSSGT